MDRLLRPRLRGRVPCGRFRSGESLFPRRPVSRALRPSRLGAVVVALALLSAAASRAQGGPPPDPRPPAAASTATATPAPVPPPPVLPVPPVVVTATKLETPVDEVASSVTVIDAETIRRAESRDILELLRDVPGVHVARTGSRGGTTSVFVRGGASDHNLVMVDGVQVNRSGGAFDFSTLTTENVERIEVVRGPMSGLWGSDGLASGIHIITRRGEGPLRAEVRAEGGSRDTFEGTALVQGGSEDGGATLSLAHSRGDGVHRHHEFRNTRARLRADWSPSPKLALGLTAWHTRGQFDFPTDFVAGVRGGFPPVDPNQGNEKHETVLGVEAVFDAEPGWTHRLHLGYADAKDRFHDPLDPIPSDFADQESIGRERRLTADYRQVLRGELASGVRAGGTVGVEWEQQWFRQSSSTAIPGLAATESRSRADRHDLGLYGQLELTLLDRATVTAGIRGDDHSDFGWVASPFASALWKLPETGTRLRASVGRGFKEPGFLETFGSAVVRGNPALEPERSTSWEVGMDQTLLGGRARAFATWFDQEFRNLIAFVGPTGGASLGTFENVLRVGARGVEVGLDVQLHDEVRAGVSYTWLDTRVEDDGGLGAPGFVEGEPLIVRPRHAGSFFVEWVRERFDVRLSGTVVGSRDDLDFGRTPTARVRNEGYVKLDLFASALLHRGAATELRVHGIVENLLDEDFEETFGFASPGLRVRGGVELRF